MKVKEFFDKNTSTLSYVVFDQDTLDALIIDPVLDYEQVSSRYFFESIEKIRNFIREQDLRVHGIFETHAHADHLSGAKALKKFFPDAPIAIGEKIVEVQNVFKDVFNLCWLEANGQQFDWLLADGQELTLGSIHIKVLSTPGHTPACVSYLIADCVFTGDALFMPDMGTGRCDFPGGSSDSLYQSVSQKLYTLPDETRVFVGHDYQPGGRQLQFETTIGEQKKSNIQLTENSEFADFKKFRDERDKTLGIPRLLYPSIQLNINAGELPPKESNDSRYLKLPLSERKT